MIEANGFILRRNWLPVGGAGVVVVLGVLVSANSFVYAPFGWFAVFLGVVFGPILFLRNAFPRARAVHYRATPGGVAIDGRDDLLAEDILEAKLTPRRDDAVVELALRGGGTLALLTSTDLARALVDLLGARRTRFRLIVPYWRRFLGLFALFAALSLLVSRNAGLFVFSLFGCAFYAVLLAWVVGLFLRGRLVVGADGFTTRWLFWERFVAFREVWAVRGTKRLGDPRVEDTLVELRSGRQRRLRTIEAPNTEAERGTESAAMLEHMSAAFERSRRLLDGSVDVPTLVKRGSRTATDWLSGLDALVRGGGSRYRVAAISPEMLAELTHDPSAAAEARVGAAAALVRMGDDAQRTRVRVAAEGCAESELRETLLALSEARDDASTVAALAKLRG